MDITALGLKKNKCYDVQLTRHEADYLVRKMSTYFTINAAGINYSIQTIQVVPNFYK